jgi:hypothetical protein
MFRITAFLAAWLIAVPAWAFLPGQPVGMLNPQVQPANASAGLPAVDDNLGAGGYPIAGGICAEWGHQVPCNNHYSVTRASTKYVSASDGTYTLVPTGVFALGSGNGGLIEEARTNLALWSRDLTQSGTWVAVTMTAALNAVGIDGAANSATTLTSSSAAGTILQNLTQGSAAYTYTVFVKGVTVTGAIQVADYPVLTPAFTTLSASNCFNPANVGTAPASGQTIFLRCTVTATSLNPVIGFKFANSGDSVIVDFNQLEAASFGTSPCLTTTATCARSADNIVPSGALAALLNNTTISMRIVTNQLAAAGFGSSRVMGVNGNGALVTTGGATSMVAFDGGTQLFATCGSGGPATLTKTVSTQTRTVSRSIVCNGGTVATDVNSTTASAGFVGSNAGTANFQDGYAVQISASQARFPDVTSKALSQ